MSNTSSSAVVSVNYVRGYMSFKVYFKSGKVYRFAYRVTREGKVFDGATVLDPYSRQIAEIDAVRAEKLYKQYSSLTAVRYDVLANYFRHVGIIKIESRVFYDVEDARAQGLDVITSAAIWSQDGRVRCEESAYL